jgi:hypothetical protein
VLLALEGAFLEVVIREPSGEEHRKDPSAGAGGIRNVAVRILRKRAETLWNAISKKT